jgi:dihydrofolate synthase/folylpolyglutamate synthase
VTVLTNVGLEHTRWLGPTVTDIAAEKLAVLAPGTTLALGADLDPQALAVAREAAAERAARIVRAPADPAPEGLLARGAFPRRNFALARTAAAAYLEAAGTPLSEPAVRAAAAATATPGRLQIVSQDPFTVFDGAHNPDAVAALVESLPEILGGRPLGLVMGVLDDKDAASMLRMLLPICARAWFTAPPSARALSPAALQSLARQLGFEQATCEPRPHDALDRAREWASGQPAQAAVLATGSIYLVGDLLAYMGELELDARGVREREGRGSG